MTGAALIAALTAAFAFAAASRAVAPGANGRIFYASNGSGTYNIWSVAADGTGPTQLTTLTTNPGAQRPSVSGDGSKVAYMQFDDTPGHVNRIEIWAMNGNGSGQTQLTTTGDNIQNTEPGISPDGSKIAFQRADVSGGGTTGQDIWIMNANGSGQTQLTSSTDDEKSPEFSRDGTKIVYVRATGGSNQIWLMNANGTNQHVLLANPGVQDTGPSWAPDGQKIVYEDGSNGLSVMNADGSNPTPLHNASDAAILAQDPTWSPDGTTIAFYFVAGGAGSEGIFTVPAAGGSNPHLVLSLPTDFQSVFPSWAAAPVVLRTVTVVEFGTGAGIVTSTPAGIDCGVTTCSAQFADGSMVTLTATPSSAFVGWSGGGCSGTGTCVLTLSGDVTVGAQFTHQPPVIPDTKLGKVKISSKKRTATFSFKAIGVKSATFQCALARKGARLKFRRCTSPKRYRHLRPGKYTFEVRAVGTVADKTPAKKKFTIRR